MEPRDLSYRQACQFLIFNFETIFNDKISEFLYNIDKYLSLCYIYLTSLDADGGREMLTREEIKSMSTGSKFWFALGTDIDRKAQTCIKYGKKGQFRVRNMVTKEYLFSGTIDNYIKIGGFFQTLDEALEFLRIAPKMDGFR